MQTVDMLNKVIGVVDAALVVLDKILIHEHSELLSEAFTRIDRGLSMLCEARFKEEKAA